MLDSVTAKNEGAVDSEGKFLISPFKYDAVNLNNQILSFRIKIPNGISLFPSKKEKIYVLYGLQKSFGPLKNQKQINLNLGIFSTGEGSITLKSSTGEDLAPLLERACYAGLSLHIEGDSGTFSHYIWDIGYANDIKEPIKIPTSYLVVETDSMGNPVTSASAKVSISCSSRRRNKTETLYEKTFKLPVQKNFLAPMRELVISKNKLIY